MAEKQQFTLEFLVKSSAKVLYQRLSTPSGLAEWFADDVNIKNDRYIFEWDGAEEYAKLLSKKPSEYIRFQWEDDEGTDYYFEFSVKTDALTKQAALVITDFSEPHEQEESELLWNAQIDNLLRLLGS